MSAAFTSQRFQGLSLTTSTNILYFLKTMGYLYYQTSDIVRDIGPS